MAEDPAYPAKSLLAQFDSVLVSGCLNLTQV
jgi:hypothetical protein